jgi:hypothetical protein
MKPIEVAASPVRNVAISVEREWPERLRLHPHYVVTTASLTLGALASRTAGVGAGVRTHYRRAAPRRPSITEGRADASGAAPPVPAQLPSGRPARGNPWRSDRCDGLTMLVMFLLVSGASGAGKSTARRFIAGELELEPEVQCVELHDVVPMPEVPTLVWRQQATEAVVCHALELQEEGRHVLLAGDPVAAGEVLAAPSADRLDAIAVCLLDVDRDTQTARLLARGDDPALLVHHVAFADWMREHATDPHYRPEVLKTDGWEQMQWKRWSWLDDTCSWRMHVLDTSHLTAAAAASELLAWCRRALAGQAPAMRVPS